MGNKFRFFCLYFQLSSQKWIPVGLWLLERLSLSAWQTLVSMLIVLLLYCPFLCQLRYEEWLGTIGRVEVALMTLNTQKKNQRFMNLWNNFQGSIKCLQHFLQGRQLQPQNDGHLSNKKDLTNKDDIGNKNDPENYYKDSNIESWRYSQYDWGQKRWDQACIGMCQSQHNWV